VADLRPIEFPDDLRTHNLSEQELAPLSPQQQAIAKDWNIMKRQSDWMVNRIVEIHNILVEHDKALDQWKFWLKIGSILASLSGAVLVWLLKSGGGH